MAYMKDEGGLPVVIENSAGYPWEQNDLKYQSLH